MEAHRDNLQMHPIVDGLDPSFTPAPKLKRALALCTDLGIISLGFYILVLIFGILMGGTAVVFRRLLESASGTMIVLGIFVLLFVLIVAAIFHLYFILFELKDGTTPGKRLFGLKVVSVDGAPLTRRQVVIRELFRAYVEVPLVLPALIVMSATEKRQRIGDLVANTLVVYSKAQEDDANFLYVQQQDYLRLLEHIRPAPVEAQIRQEYLRFAYQEFILRQHPAAPSILGEWETRIRALCPRMNDIGLNQVTVLRFFAEYCVQDANRAVVKK